MIQAPVPRDPSPPPPGPVVSWQRVLGPAVAALGVIVAVGAAVVAADVVQDPQRFGEGLARLALVSMLIAGAVSYLAQLGRRRTAVAVAVGSVALLGLVTGLLVGTWDDAPANPLTPAERSDLRIEVRDDRRWLAHPTLGFAVRHPGPSFEPAREVAVAMANADADDGMATWGFVDRHTGEALAVMAVKGIESRQDLEGFLKGFRDSLGSAGGRIDREEVAWGADRREVRLDMVIDGEARVSIRALGAPLGPDRAPFLVAILATTDDPARAAALVESLALR